jgi:hypothetical protein
MFWFKAWNARNSRAIAKFCNVETGHFNHNMSIHDLIRGTLEGQKLFTTEDTEETFLLLTAPMAPMALLTK